MAILRRYNRYQGLKDLDVFIDDDAPISQYFNVAEVPDIITQGRSSFLVGGSPLLKNGVELKFEIINDASGKVIYTEPVANYLEGEGRRVSIEVYDDPDTFGDATLYCLGELDPNEVNVPTEWLDIYNVRWYRKLYISSTGVNTEPIFFYNEPSMWIGEIKKGYVTTSYPTGSVTQSTGTVSGDPLSGTEGTPPPADKKPDRIRTLKRGYKSKVFGGGGKNAGVSRRGRRVRKRSPEVDRFDINLGNNGKADLRHVGATLEISNPKVDTTRFTTESYHRIPDKFTTEIVDVKSDTKIIPKKEFTIIDTREASGSDRREIVVPLAETSYTLTFQPAPTHSVSEVNFRSFADVRISKMRTFSGDVHRVKLYAKNKDAFGDFQLIADTPIESPEILYDVYSSAGSKRIGYFLDQDTLDSYWEAASNTTASLNSTYVLDAVYISGSNATPNSTLRFQTTGSRPMDFYKDVEYSFKARILGRRSNKVEFQGTGAESIGELAIFLSGSSFVGNHNYGNSFGYQITPPGETQPGLLTIDQADTQIESDLKDFGYVEEIFQPLYDGQGILQFGVPAGNWYLSDISITPIADTGFSPDWIRVVAPVPPFTDERPDDFEFMAEFYDVNNNLADTVAHVSASTFEGANSYILGDDNVLSGSMFIGNAIGSGIEMAGVGSGFIRSIGYQGFTSASAASGSGFMMWSGSVLSDVTDDYSAGGVGLELVLDSGSYFKFRTNPSELDIRTDSFFIGQESIQFMSGSESNIEISSSLFWLDPKNDRLIIGADATINADLSVNNIYAPAGTNINTAKAAITSQGYAKFISASIGAFKLNDDSLFSGPNEAPNFFISGSATGTDYFISSSNFQVRASGEVSASSLQLDGGSVGGLTVSDGQVSVGEILKLKDSGQITGSTVLFTGGKIAGWKIDGNTLSGSNATLDAAGAALYMSDKGPDTDDSAAFDILRDEYYIDFTPSGQGNDTNYYVKFGPNFAIDSDGVLIASGAVFEGQITASTGQIGGAAIESASLAYAPYWRISSSANVEDPASFISSSLFKVSAGGLVTGSAILLGDKAGGNYLQFIDDTLTVQGSITADNIRTPSSIGGSPSTEQNASASISSAGYAAFRSASIGGFEVSTNKINSTNDNLILLSSGQITGSNVLFDGGKIGGWEISSSFISKAISGSAAYQGYSRVYMSSVNDNQQNIAEGFTLYRKDEDIADGSTKVVRVGGLSDTTNLHANNDYGLQVIQQDSQNNYSNLLYIGSSTQTLSGWNISTTGFVDPTGAVQLSSTQASMSLGTSQEVVIRGNSNSPFISLQPAVALPDKAYAEMGIMLAVAGGSTPLFSVVGTGGHIKFDGTDLDITADTVHFSGSSVTIATPTMFFGATGSAYISSSDGNMEISSSGLFVDASGNTTMQGTVTATAGSIGGFHINANNMWGGNAAIDNAATKIVFGAIQDGDTPKIAMGTSADDITLVGGTGLYVDGDGDFKVGSPTKYLKYTVSGNALEVKAGGLEIDASNIEISSTQASMSLGEGKIRLVGGGTSTMTLGTGAASVTMSSNGTDSLISMGSKTNFSSEGSGTAGILIGMDASNPQAEFVKDSSNYLIFDDGIDIKTDTLKASGSNIILEAPRFFLGGTNQYVSGSNGNIEISSSAFHLTPEGNVTASNIILGDKSEGDYLQFVGGTLTVQGDVTANEIRTPATIAGSPSTGLNASSSISSTGLARFVSASIGGFHVSDSQINDTDSNLILKSSGHITGSKVLFTAGKIAQWTIDGHLLKSAGDGGIRLNGNPGGAEISVGTHTFGNGPGIQLHYNSGNPQFFAGTSGNYLKYTVSNGVDIKTIKANISGSEITLAAPKFYLGDSSNYISGSDGNLKIFSSGETTLSGSNINLKTPHMFLGATGSAYVSSSDGDLEISSSTFFLKSDGTLNIGAGDFTVDTSGNVVMAGSVTATTGTIGGWTINSTNISSSGMYMDSSNKKLIIKSATFGSSGIQAEYNSGTPRFYVGDGSNRYLKFDGTDVDIKSAKFILDTDNLDINSTTKRITVTDGSNERVRIGEVGGTKYGIKIFDGSGTAASDEIVHLSDAKYQIASWSLSPTQITSENLVLDSSGIIQTSDFASGVKGWRITSANNGEAEFEKVTVRGTLATTVFEKESVNAVGGQLYVANSTIISSSTQISATETTWSVANVGGFTGSYFNSGSGEILSVKKVTDTGFQTEYVLIQSASRDYPSSNTDFMGKLYVVRGYSGSSPTDSGSLGDEASSATTYENGQVIVSTGRLNTGYIRLNANPNDSTTPYIDIVERTGSAIYDVSLKARLGDLSGLSSGLLYGNSSPGFGLFTENVFLQGAITATTGSFDGIVHIRTDSTNQIQMGTNVNSTHDGIQVDTNNFWYTTGDFRAGGASSNYFYISGSSIDINADTFDLSTSTVKIKSAQNSGMLSLGSTPNLDVTGSNSGIYMDGTGDFLAYGDAENFFKKDGTALTINAATFGLGTATMIISSSANSGTIRMGSNGGPISYTANTAGIYMDGTGKFQVYGDAANYLRFDGATVDIKTDEIDIYASGGTNKMRLLADGTNTPSIALGPTLNSTVAGTNAGIYMDGTGDFLAYGDSKNYFRFDVGGTPVLDIKAETAYLSGSSITLKSPEFFLGDTSNYISGSGGAIDIAADTFSLGTTTLVISSSVNSGTLSLGATPNTTGSGTNKGVYMDGTGDFLAYTNATNYIRKSQNKLDIKADTFDLATTTMIMDSGVNSGKIALGNTPPSSVAYTSNAGIYMDGTGDFLVRGDNDNYIKMYSNTIDIKSEVFGLGTPTMVISSSVNGGTIRMGANGGPISQTANTAGTYIDGNGKFQVFGDSSNYLRIDGSTIDMRTTTFYLSGSDITLKSPDFFLGDSSNYISGSDGNLAIYSTGNTTLSGSSITLATPHLFMGATGSAYVSASDGELEISSSKFLLKSDGSMNAGAGAFTLDTSGNVTISGSISSSEGNIAGWNMTSYILSSHDENGGLKLDSYNKQFGIRTGSHVDTTIIELGRIGGSVGSPQFGIEGLDSSDITKTLFKFGEAGNEIAGWTITDAEIKSGTNISLNSTDKALYINNSTFGNDGIQLMYNGGNPKMYVGDGSNEFLKFDGSSLSIQTQDAHISGSSITLKSPDFYLGDTSNYISGSGGNLAISSSKFYLASDGSINAGVGAFTVSSDGNVFISGSVSSSIGNIGGWTIDADEIKAGGVKLDSDSSDGQIKLGSATALNTGDGIYMDGTGDFRAGDANGHRLEWNGSGVIVSSSDFFLGDATNFISGSGGAVNIESQEFDLNTNNLRVSSSYGGTVAMGKTIPKSISGSGVFLSGSGDFLAGNHAGNKIQFNTAASAVVMKSNTFSLDASTIVIDSSTNNGKIALGASPNTSVAGTNTGIYMDGTGDFLAYGDGDNFIKFDVGGSPVLEIKAEDIDLQGSNFKLEADGSAGTFYLGTITSDSDTSGAGVFMDSGGHFRVIGNSTNQLIVDGGSLTMKSDTFDLATSNILLRSAQNSGMLSLGSTPNLDVTGSNAGIYMDGTGDFLAYGDGDNFLKKDGTSLTISAETFDLNSGGKLILNSTQPELALGHADARLTLGATANTSISGTNKGIYMDGGGDFLLYGSATNYFKFDASGTSIDIKTDTFDLATSTMVMDSVTQDGYIGLGATAPRSISGSSKGFYADGKGQLLIGDATKNNLKFDGTNLAVSSSIMVSGSMTIGTANSSSADPDSYLAVGKVSDPFTNTSGIEMRKDYFSNFRLTYGQLHQDKTSAGSFSTACNGSGSGTSAHLGGHGTADNCSAAVMPEGAVGLSMIYVHGQCGTAFLSGTAARFDDETTGENDMVNIEIDKDETNLVMRLVTWAEFTDDHSPTGHARSPNQNYVSISGVHTGLAPGDYIGIGKGFFTEIAYVTAVPRIGHNRKFSYGELLDSFRKVPYWVQGAAHARDGENDPTVYGAPPATTSGTTTDYYQYLSTTGYSVVTLVRDCFNRGIRYSNHYDTPENNPEDYVEILNCSSSADPGYYTDGGGSHGGAIDGAYYIPLPALQPHGDSQWYAGGTVTRINYRNWRDSGRKVVVFTSTPKPIPTMMVGKGGMIMAVDKDEAGQIKAEVGWKIYSEFSTERASGQGSYESGLGLLNPS